MNKYFILLMGFFCLNATPIENLTIKELEKEEAKCHEKNDTLNAELAELTNKVEKNPESYEQLQPQLEEVQKKMQKNNDRLEKLISTRVKKMEAQCNCTMM